MKLVYDFSGFYSIFESIKDNSIDVPLRTAEHLKKEINNFFKDSTCKEVIYTVNTDKQFFGIKVYGNFDRWTIYDNLMSNDSYRINEYSVEIDSKLLDPALDLCPKELTAILLKEIGGVINDNSPMRKARDYLTMYLTENKTTLKISDSINYREILCFGVKDFTSKCNSVIYMNDEDMVMTDEMSKVYGFYDELNSAFSKISNMKPYGDSEQTLGIVFSWILRLYCSVAIRRIGSIKTLTTCKALTASKLEIREFDILIKRIQRIDDSSLLQESVASAINARMMKMRVKTIKNMEDDFYEIIMQVKNVEDEDDALYLMRQINSRMSILSDYIDESSIPEKEKQRCMAIYDKYYKLREELSKTQTYKRSTTAIYVNYPDIKDYRS